MLMTHTTATAHPTLTLSPQICRSTCKGQSKHPGDIKSHFLFSWTVSKVLKHEHMPQYYSLHKNTYVSRYTV